MRDAHQNENVGKSPDDEGRKRMKINQGYVARKCLVVNTQPLYKIFTLRQQFTNLRNE